MYIVFNFKHLTVYAVIVAICMGLCIGGNKIAETFKAEERGDKPICGCFLKYDCRSVYMLSVGANVQKNVDK